MTNHYITREDHPCFGTNQRTILSVNGSTFTLSNEKGPRPSPIKWPKAADVEMDKDGTIRIYDDRLHGPDNRLFLTLVPGYDESDSQAYRGSPGWDKVREATREWLKGRE